MYKFWQKIIGVALFVDTPLVLYFKKQTKQNKILKKNLPYVEVFMQAIYKEVIHP